MVPKGMSSPRSQRIESVAIFGPEIAVYLMAVALEEGGGHAECLDAVQPGDPSVPPGWKQIP
jgi:hypothetical protein